MLKWIAMFLMLIDHFAIIVQDIIPYEFYLTLRAIGRMCFPIFVYYVVLGVKRTSNLNKYMGRLLVFAIVSEVFRRMFDVFVIPELNVIFSMLFYAILYAIVTEKRFPKWISVPLAIMLSLIVGPYIEYGHFGILLFLSLQFVYNMKDMKRTYAVVLIAFSYFITLYPEQHIIQALAALSGLLMFNSSLEERVFSRSLEKWAFYIIYPLQFIVFGLIYQLIV